MYGPLRWDPMAARVDLGMKQWRICGLLQFDETTTVDWGGLPES